MANFFKSISKSVKKATKSVSKSFKPLSKALAPVLSNPMVQMAASFIPGAGPALKIGAIAGNIGSALGSAGSSSSKAVSKPVVSMVPNVEIRPLEELRTKQEALVTGSTVPKAEPKTLSIYKANTKTFLEGKR